MLGPSRGTLPSAPGEGCRASAGSGSAVPPEDGAASRPLARPRDLLAHRDRYIAERGRGIIRPAIGARGVCVLKMGGAGRV
jgi:hypothetical protein